MQTIEVFKKTLFKKLQIKNKKMVKAITGLLLYTIYNSICTRRQGEKSLLHEFVKNRHTYLIDDSVLCWFWCISFLIDSPKLKESVHERVGKAIQCFYDFYGYSHLDEINKKRRWMSMQDSCW
jgi:hypothetical protein